MAMRRFLESIDDVVARLLNVMGRTVGPRKDSSAQRPQTVVAAASAVGDLPVSSATRLIGVKSVTSISKARRAGSLSVSRPSASRRHRDLIYQDSAAQRARSVMSRRWEPACKLAWFLWP